MNFGQAIKSGFAGYVKFSGRASRSAYWYWILFTVLVGFGVGIVEVVLFGLEGRPVLTQLWNLATLLPFLAVGARRLHDINKSGWWQLLGLVPIVGWIILLVWFVRRGVAGGTPYGRDPLADEAAA